MDISPTDPAGQDGAAQTLRFTKMQGLGNDFIVIDAISRPVHLTTRQIGRLADRRFGVGCDQVLLAEAPTRGDAHFRVRIYNADGGEVEHCGNGVRCVARFLAATGLSTQREIRLQTGAAVSTAHLAEDGSVSVNMGAPILEPAEIPFRAGERAPSYRLVVDGQPLTIAAVSMGNPHAVLRVGDVDTAPVATLGPRIESHPDFPKRVNAGFMAVVNRGHIRLRVYERGAGETLACGTGACAAVVAGRLQGWLDPRVTVKLPGGRLVIHWRDERSPVWMTGPANRVFEGEIPL